VTDPAPDAPLEAKLRARVTIIGAWVAGHDDRDALKRDLERAKLAWAEIRHAGDVLNSPTVAARGTIVTVTDSDGEPRPVVRMPHRFSNAGSGPVRGVPETGETPKTCSPSGPGARTNRTQPHVSLARVSPVRVSPVPR
jgi:crotonobetainyl-CoA:carnitine CoA-transferase CaiB-like acyl-CoA transferase